MYERMSSGWSHRATQRSTSASSNSSISSKWRFATPSSESGQSLSEGCSSGECEGGNSRCIPSGTLSFFFAVCQPARSSTSRTRFPLPAPTSLAKFSKALENASASPWGGSTSGPLRFSGARRRRGVGPLVTLVGRNSRPFSDGAPHPADDRLEARTVLVLAPQLYLRCWVSLLEPGHPHRG